MSDLDDNDLQQFGAGYFGTTNNNTRRNQPLEDEEDQLDEEEYNYRMRSSDRDSRNMQKDYNYQSRFPAMTPRNGGGRPQRQSDFAIPVKQQRPKQQRQVSFYDDNDDRRMPQEIGRASCRERV